MTAVPLTVGLILVRKAMKAVKRMMDVVPFPVTRDSDSHTQPSKSKYAGVFGRKVKSIAIA